jgi:hypothetical protein
MCCGQKRSLLSNPVARSQPRPVSPTASASPRAPNSSGRPTTPAPISPSSGDITLRYLKTAPVRVRGLITGRSYEFTAPQLVANIDPRDVPGLLSTGLFRRG